MNYEQTIDFLYTKLPMFSRIGELAIKKELTNIRELCHILQEPQTKIKTVHIAGTNGKGSVSHMLAAIFQTAGYKTGLYTSPHLKDFRERIKINGEMISREFVTDFTQQLIPEIERIQPSFFEITVAMAFTLFANEQVDIAIIETGLGGRLDSTNIITPELSVITNIGMDHMNLLGDTLDKIAFEKAGIIKQDVPVVIGEVLPETIPVFEKTARERNATLNIASQKRQAVDWSWQKQVLTVEVAEEHKTDHHLFQLDLPGIYQVKNLLTVLEAIAQLKKSGWHLPDEAVTTGLRHSKKITGLHGRWEMIQQHPLVVLDVAHNPDGIRQLTEQVELTSHTSLHIVLGVVKDKDIDEVLSLLPATAQYYFTRAQIPRALDAAELQAKALAKGLHGATYPDVNTALAAAKQKAAKGDLVLVCGSVFLVGEVHY
ncbi:MAG TPA: folylpolyglutamate synthase/dihydrofolate synthase family protein [Chitinophagaceae bacterium]|jgi:dihydrofolate synthase/folylpolyglutamate synthase|nr:folylpolyglutamate synthase/dihydrofolate synthase family protein [Chitinophagaceae bacterium]